MHADYNYVKHKEILKCFVEAVNVLVKWLPRWRSVSELALIPEVKIIVSFNNCFYEGLQRDFMWLFPIIKIISTPFLPVEIYKVHVKNVLGRNDYYKCYWYTNALSYNFVLIYMILRTDNFVFCVVFMLHVLRFMN